MISLKHRVGKFISAAIVVLTFLNFKVINDYSNKSIQLNYIEEVIGRNLYVKINESYPHKENIDCIMKIWKGATCNQPSTEEINLSIVVSHYYGEDETDLFNYYILSQDVQLISHNFIPMEPKWNYRDLNILQWLVDTSSSLTGSDIDDNHFTLFMSSYSVQAQDKHEFHDVLQSTLENGFGCVERPPGQRSYYHEKQMLRTFAHPDKEAPRYYSNLGDWQDNLNLTPLMDGPIVPVCYGSSFLIQTRSIAKNRKLYQALMEAIQADSINHALLEQVEFLERTWAIIFTNHLSKQKYEMLRHYSTGVFNKTCCYTGSLLHTISDSYLKFFKGDTLIIQEVDYSKLRLSLVISYCDEDMSWMRQYLSELRVPIQNVTIYSKCNNTISEYTPPNSTIIRMPNVGRCDHSYAHWMNSIEETDFTENDYVFFVKASRIKYQVGMSYRNIHDVIRIAMQHGFSCELQPSDKSIYYDTNLLKTFWLGSHKEERIKSNYSDMGAWLDELGIELPSPVTPVCYGGNFVVKVSQIYDKQNIWEKIVSNLMRGDNIEEGHFTERSWAGLLSRPLSVEESFVLQSLPTKFNDININGYIGQMVLVDDESDQDS